MKIFREVYVFVSAGVTNDSLTSASSAIDNRPSQPSYRLRTVASSARPFTTFSGRRIQPDLSISDVKHTYGSMLILPDCDLWSVEGSAEILELAHAFRIRGLSVAAISASTLALARAGILDDFHHTSNSRAYLAASGYRGASFYCEVPAIADEGLITASQSAPSEFAREIARELGLYNQPQLDAWHALRSGEPLRHSAPISCTSR